MRPILVNFQYFLYPDRNRFMTPCIMLFLTVITASGTLADNIYELRKITENEWLSMSTEERLSALGSAEMHERNQTFMGDFGRNSDLYSSWGYNYYEMEDRYESYAFRNYQAYNVLENRRRRWSYNMFGDRITKMSRDATIWSEVNTGNDTYYTYEPSRYINSIGGLSGVWVVRESTKDWAISVIGAEALRTKFTPLTLSIPNMEGVSFDFQSANSSLKLITSAYVGGGSGTSSTLYRYGGIMLRGGRFRRKFGVLTLGTTYVSSYGVQGNREHGGEWRGTVTNSTPTPIMVAVRFIDDSPEDNRGGPVVYDVKLKINGRYRSDIIPRIYLDDVSRDRTTAITDMLESMYLEPSSIISTGHAKYDFLSIGSTLPKYADYLYSEDIMRGSGTKDTQNKFSTDLANSFYTLTEQAGKPLSADGTDAVVYLFDLKSVSGKINRIEAVTTVANDYHIQTSMIYTLESRGGHDDYGKVKTWYDATYWQTAAQAEGNITDGSNVDTITVDFGYQIASVIYGIDADLNYLGFRMKGEYVTNSTRYMFADGAAGTGTPANVIDNQPPRTGHRWSVNDHAYYLIAEKDWDTFGFAGEIFSMGKFYKPYFDYFILRSCNARNHQARIPLIEDNDDNDIYPDTMLTQRSGYGIRSLEDPDGVFPGNDDDNDGIPDNNKNNNGIPDYFEPFMRFDVDPDEFVIGNDFNNNTIPDFREDDMKMDTPYDLDRRGHHVYFRVTPLSRVNFVFGTYRTKGVGSSGRNFNDYMKAILDYDVFGVGKVYAEYRHESIKDNIRDQYIQVNQSMKQNYVLPGTGSSLGRFNRDLYYDELEYRNSGVDRLYVDSRIRVIPAITLENHVKYERNNQIDGIMYDGIYQPHDVLSSTAVVNKLVYTKRLGDFVISPGIKFQLYKRVRSQSLQPLDHYLMRIPLIMLTYIISDNTDIMLGLEGIPKMELDYTNYVQSQNDYRQKYYVLQLQNKTRYFGYDIWGAVGITREEMKYDSAYRQYEEFKSSSAFVRIFLGW